MKDNLSELARKEFLLYAMTALASATSARTLGHASADQTAGDVISLEDLRAMEKIAGIHFTDDERKEVLGMVQAARNGYIAIRDLPIDSTVQPRTVFTPLGGGSIRDAKVSVRSHTSYGLARPSDEDLAFLTVAELGHLVRTGEVSPIELTQLYLKRLKKYGDALLCVVNLTEELALEQAKRAETEILKGHYRGPLHGIPYGLKDLFSTRGIPTTWGAAPFVSQIFDFDSAVVERLRHAGAILVAKLSLGALAQNETWFRGKTRNPWIPSEGSGGSSAGPGAAVAAGLVPFAIGSETQGSIISPSIRCRVTGLRPTYGRVSRFGAMELSYTMDKPGPMCRVSEDCALVLGAICGSDPRDPSAVDRPFIWPKTVNFRNLKIGWLVPPSDDVAGISHTSTAPADDPVVSILRKRGAKVFDVSFSHVPNGVPGILDIEAASAFDEFTRGDAIKGLQNSNWPPIFRANRYVPAVEYLKLQRARTLLMHQFEHEFGDLDAFICVGRGYTMVHTNLTGHPQILVPLKDGDSRSIVCRLYSEDIGLAIAHTVQTELQYHRLRPDLSRLA